MSFLYTIIGDNMRKYYLFAIKSEYSELYSKNPYILYKTIENLYKLKKEDLVFGMSLYNQICNIIEVDRLRSYFDSICKIKKNNKYLIRVRDDVALFNIHYSCIICKCNKNFPNVFNVMNYYNKYLFVCDFENKDYFFLTKRRINNNNSKYTYV